jgi:hypothetical protein
MLLLHQLVQEYLPSKRRQNPKGWWIFDSVCCHHRGHNHDTRSRGNLLITADGAIIVNCYNCGFKTGYRGGDITNNFELWLTYLGIPRTRIQEAKLEILSKKLNGELENIDNSNWFRAENFSEVELPRYTNSFDEWLQADEIPDEFAACVEYLTTRGRAVAEGYQYHWTPNHRWDLNCRIIIPFYHQNKIIGWTGRYAGVPPKNIPRYFNSDLPTGYLFNNKILTNKFRKYVLVSEGPFDAIAVDGVATLGSKMNKQQIEWLNSSEQEKIIVPDRQLKNQELIDVALDQGWSVSFPEWEEGIKDAADASKKYGKLYTLYSIIQSKTDSKLQIGMKRQMIRG